MKKWTFLRGAFWGYSLTAAVVFAAAAALVSSCQNPVGSPPESPPAYVTGVTITSGDISWPKNSGIRFFAEVDGDNNYSQEVIWELTALDENDAETTKEEETVIDDQGELSIAGGEGAVSLRIRAVSVGMNVSNEKESDEITVTLLPEDTPVVNGGKQLGALASGREGTARYFITTNVETESDVTVTWYADGTVGTAVPAPAGITDNAASLTVDSNYAALEFTANDETETPLGTYWFTVTIDGVESSRQTLVVNGVDIGSQGGAAITLTASNKSRTLQITGAENPSIAKSSGSLNLSVTGSGFTSFKWIVDGVQKGTEPSITLTGTDYSLGGHSVTVYADGNDGALWSPTSPIIFNVEAR